MAAPTESVWPEFWGEVLQVPPAAEFSNIKEPKYKDFRTAKQLVKTLDALVMAGVYIECETAWNAKSKQPTLFKILSRNFGHNPKPNDSPNWSNTEEMWMGDLRAKTCEFDLDVVQIRRMNRRQHLKLQNITFNPASPALDHDDNYATQLENVTARLLEESKEREKPVPGPIESTEVPGPAIAEPRQRATRNRRESPSTSSQHRTRSTAALPDPVGESSDMDIGDNALQQHILQQEEPDFREAEPVYGKDCNMEPDRMEDVEGASPLVNSPGRKSRHRTTSMSVRSGSPSGRCKSKSRSRSVSKVPFDQIKEENVPETGDVLNEFQQVLETTTKALNDQLVIVFDTTAKTLSELKLQFVDVRDEMERKDRRSRTPTPGPVVPGAGRVTRAARDNWMVGGKHLGVWRRPEDGHKLDALITSFES